MNTCSTVAQTEPRPELLLRLLRLFSATFSAAKRVCARAAVHRTERKLKLRETLPLGERRFIALVEFEGQQLLIGGTANSIVLLKSVHNDNEFSRHSGDSSASRGSDNVQ